MKVWIIEESTINLGLVMNYNHDPVTLWFTFNHPWGRGKVFQKIVVVNNHPLRLSSD
ncbi:hypothetical protein IQ225_11740 [Synechocystis salina LEGE 06155]|nr:hypothetical protein [Synechocystis salina LEGE 06155]